MKKQKPLRTQHPPLRTNKRTFEDENYGAPGTDNYTVTDKQQEQGEQSYDNEGAFGIGQIKSK